MLFHDRSIVLTKMKEGTMSDRFSIETAIKLGELCQQTYTQYDSFNKGNEWKPPCDYNQLTVIHVPLESGHIPIGFVAQSAQDVYVAWRGTDNLEEWVQDVKFEQVECAYLGSDVRIELGFNEIYMTEKSSVSPRQAVLDALAQHGPINNLYVTGHSLGGALAILNALDIAKHLSLKPIVYTLASPRVGSPEFVYAYSKMNLHTWRVVNAYDEVPKLPPKSCPPLLHEYHYGHVHHEYRISFGNRLNLPFNHGVEHYVSTLRDIYEKSLVD